MHVLELFPEELERLFADLNSAKYRSQQLLNWLYGNIVTDLSQMRNLPQKLRNDLSQRVDFEIPQIARTIHSADGTSKYLLKLKDDNFIEMVLIPHLNKNTLCISSQVGCSRSCKFCATAGIGLIRNLQANEIIAQVLLAKRLLQEKNLTNLVFMGMGEPLDNLDNVIKAIRLLQHDECFNFSPRRITISTCGIVPGISRLAESGLKIKLAVSLNSAIQTKREKLMPIAKKYPLTDLKHALLDFSRKTNFRITFEYIMIKDFNMRREDVKALQKLLGDISCKLNIIKWNQVPQIAFQAPSEQEIADFRNELENLTFAVTYRKSRGEEIAAACGQLAGNYEEYKHE